ncbi:MAG: DUF4949 domain-containing protein [Pseudomonadota bacterium]|nr:DUF4949 domain-containing protein [Pseudomonadota bacterium]
MLKQSLFTALVVSSLSAFTATAFAEPTACPSVDAIKGVPLNIVDAQTTRHHSHHDKFSATSNVIVGDEQWTFTLSGLKGKNEDCAVKQAEKALAKLTGNPKPALDETTNSYVCIYEVGHHLTAQATLPVQVK